MQKYLYLLTTSLFALFNHNASAQWQTYNIGFDDKLTGIVVQEPKVVVAGHNGIYVSTNGINSTGWKRLSAVSPQYSPSFSRTKFTHCFSDNVGGKDQAFACGYDTISQKAVLYYINMQNWSLKRIYHGKRGSVINKICYSKGYGKYIGVGSGGFILSFDSTGYDVMECPYKYDLVSILADQDNYGTYLTITSKNYLIQDAFKQGIHNFSATHSLDGNLKDAFVQNSSSQRIDIVGNSYQYINGSNVHGFNNFDVDTLKANCIINFGSYNFVGTEYGVYRSGKNSYNYLEKQPGSLTSQIHCFLILNSGLLAGCDKGNLLFTKNFGGATQVFAEIKSKGSCLNESAYVSTNFGSATACKWYVDGVNVSNTCQNYSQTFKNLKAYEIKLIAENDSGYRDTAVVQYHVVNYPNNKIKFTFSDTVLCKEGRVDVKLDSSEVNTYYLLKAGFGTGKSYGGAFGNGSMAKYTSAKLTETGTYVIEASSTKATCSQVLKHKVSVRVEKTTAKIYAQGLNVPINDTALFFEHSTDAQNFKWNFSPEPVWYNDFTGRTAAVFNKEGEVTATLMCWSDKGCRDTAISKFTNVYNPNYTDPDSCWNLKIHGIDMEYERHLVNAMIPLRNGGFLIDGSSPVKPVFESRKGKGLVVSTPDEGYIARYDSKGVLNWVIGKDRSPVDYSTLESNNDKIISEDTKGNILVASPKFLRDASGRVLDTDGHLLFAKLNRFGELIFMITATMKKYYNRPLYLFTDHHDNIYTISTFYDNSETQLFRNGDSLTLLKSNPMIACTFILTKFDSKGNLLWNRPYSYTNSHNDEIDIFNLAVDANSNVYITGSTRYALISCDPTGSRIDKISDWVNGATGYRVGFLQKLDSNGFLVWCCKMYTLDYTKKPPTVNATRTFARESETNSNGSTFLIGINNVHYDHRFVFENADGSTTSAEIGDQYLMKVDANGMAKWIVGTKTNDGYYGDVKDISLRGGEIVIMGNSANDRNSGKPSVFTSTNGDSIVLDFKQYRWDYYLAHYDTNGVLSKINVSGITENPGYPQKFTPFDFYRNNSEYYVLAQSFYNPFYNTSFYSFGSAIDIPVDTRPGYVCRFTEGCGITYLPNQSCKPKNLTVNHLKSSCDSLISQGGFKYTKSGLYIERDTFKQNCDTTFRTIHLNLKVVSSVQKFYNINGCEQFVSPSGRVYDSTGLYSEIFTSGNGCDSVIRYQVRILDYKNTVIEDTACKVFQLGSGKHVYGTGFYVDTFVAKSGCDSFVYSAIVIYEVESGIELKDSILVCTDSAGSYKWYDCTNKTPIPTAISRTFKPTKSGNYACIIVKNDCFDTSGCLAYNMKTHVREDHRIADIKVYPNPSKRTITIELNDHPKNLTASLFNMSGQLVTTRKVHDITKFDITLPEVDRIYTLNLQYDGGSRVFRIIRN